MAKNKYRVWCDTEQDYAYVWADSLPTECPNDAGHTIDSDKSAVIERRKEFIFDPTNGPDFKIVSADGNTTKSLTLNNNGNIVIGDSELEHNTSKYEVININQEETTSNSFIDLPSVVLDNSKPKAGTYIVFFSCVARNSNANGWTYVILNKENTGDIAHSERRMQGNKESSLDTQAVITVNGSEYIKLRFKRDSKGKAEISNSSLVAVRLGD